MTSSTDQDKNQGLLESLQQTVKELEEKLGYTTKGLGKDEEDRLDTLFHNAKKMRRFIEPTDF